MIDLPPNTHNVKLEENETLISIPIPGSLFPNNQGIVGILAKPFIFRKEGSYSLALILHGRGGHKNYIYQRQLSTELAKVGIYSFRFDFRDCGDSQRGITSMGNGRPIDQDLDDIAIVSEALQSNKDPNLKELIEELSGGLVLNLMVGHSRGSMAMFQFILKNQNNSLYKDIRLVNCASRFNSTKILELFLPDSRFMDLTYYRFGKYETTRMSYQEVINLSRQSLTQISSLSRAIRILSIYGEIDQIVPKDDPLCFVSHLGTERHDLKIIRDADHNFIGIKTIDSSIFSSKSGTVPRLKNGKMDYNYLVVQEIIKWLETPK